jgi:hypothetical protein
MTTAVATQLTEHGIYDDLDEELYHGDPFAGGSLSSSEARTLLQAPARYRWNKDHAEAPKRVWDFGKAAHSEVLGVGGNVEVRDFPDFKTAKAREWRDDVYAAGGTPVLAKDWEIVEDMATALRAHPIAGRLLAPGTGKAEQSLFWPDPETGITRRARVDWLRNPGDRRRIIVDYKTARSAEPRAFARAAAEHGYHQQAPWYIDGVTAICGDADPAFLFVVQEKDPPYLVSVVELDEEALAIGSERNRRAITTYVECMRTGEWPAYTTQIELIALPRWVSFQHQEDTPF